jgi:hypothetical protein
VAGAVAGARGHVAGRPAEAGQARALALHAQPPACIYIFFVFKDAFVVRVCVCVRAHARLRAPKIENPPEQLWGHSRFEQSAAAQPASHAHSPSAKSQMPWPEQLFMHSASPQSVPVNHRSHTHLPSRPG